jgi:hypothetical protein
MLARPQLTPDIAQRYLDEIDTELARRAAKRMEAGRFLDFCRDPDLFQEYPVFYHEDLCATLQRIESGEIKRAMFFLPPGAAKSTYGSVRFPCWYLGSQSQQARDPRLQRQGAGGGLWAQGAQSYRLPGFPRCLPRSGVVIG